MGALAQEIFPRLEMVWGNSQDSVPQYHEAYIFYHFTYIFQCFVNVLLFKMQYRNPDVKCDVISVDGDHSTEGTYADLKNMHKMASCRNWVYNFKT